MLKILIIEDEIPARKKIKRFLSQMQEEVEVVAEITTVAEALSFIPGSSIDLILSDIELMDGNAFEIYRQVQLSCPIIFTTAYDQFWMEAFESNGIEYLLKPFSLERFQKAWNKFLLLRKSPTPQTAVEVMKKLHHILEHAAPGKAYKKRFTVNTLHGMYFVETEEIAYFEANEGVIFAFDQFGKKHLLSQNTLKEIETQINPLAFYRINRRELIHKKYVEKVERYTKNALAVKIKGYEKYLISSQSHTAGFRQWIEQ